jgi:alpha-tubulin N-acetyltransferase 1
MEFNFDVRRAVRCDSQGFSVHLPRNETKTKELCEIIDTMGRESSRAQGLRSTITTSVRFYSSSDNKIYLKTEGRTVVGILKTGIRKLFYTNEVGKIIEMSPLCLLDFYVHESCQRSGYGKELYEYMLRNENTGPNKIAIDRPSPKMIGFMRKNYGLTDYIPQNNNFVVYRQYFSRDYETPTRPVEEVKTNINPTQVYATEYRQEEKKQSYVSMPPWAVSSKFTPYTTSSQYGSHSYRK